MRQKIMSQLRGAADKRRMMVALPALAGAAGGPHTPLTAPSRIAPTAPLAPLATQTVFGPLAAMAPDQRDGTGIQRTSYAPLPAARRTPRPSGDFTMQVMARLATPPTPPAPDPRALRVAQTRARARVAARVYGTLVLVSAVALAALALTAPWVLVAAVAGVVSFLLVAVTALALASKVTGGALSGLGIAYATMLAALAPPLLMLARRGKRAARLRGESARNHRRLTLPQ